MRKQSNMYSALSTVILLAVLSLVLAACGGGAQAPATSAPSQSGAIDAAALLQTRCSTCHSVNEATRERLGASQWEQMVTDMVRRGAQLSDVEKAALVEYLAANYGR
jgi:mono/diheme cytochrome c family protein